MRQLGGWRLPLQSNLSVIPSEAEESLTISLKKNIMRCLDFARHDKRLLLCRVLSYREAIPLRTADTTGLRPARLILPAV